MGQGHRWKACLAAASAAVLLLFWGFLGKSIDRETLTEPGYVSRLFDDSRVHAIDIRTEDWEDFLERAPKEAYIPCNVTVDGEEFAKVGVRAKGNNSLRLTEEYGLRRYSLKLEFDHYESGRNYYGLDKFSLDSSFQDNSYMKSFLAYDMMRFMEVPAPLCSYVWVTVNGAPWGLFLAVEEPEEGFAERNFGGNYGKLYKPDYRLLAEENADVALRYVDEDPDSYDNIFRNAKFPINAADQERLIRAIRTLDSGENLESAVDVDEVLRYFAVQVFVMNWDSYLGRTGHNYFLYEEDGRISMLPWDYNLAFGTYALGMTDPIRDPNVLINYPINTPAAGEVMLERPLYHNLMKNDVYFQKYHKYFDQFLKGYMESGYFQERIHAIQVMITPYVEKDPTAFCNFEDFLTAVGTLEEICLLRAQSVRGQLEGAYPSTFRQQLDHPDAGVEASHVNIRDLGDFDDLKNAGSSCLQDCP